MFGVLPGRSVQRRGGLASSAECKGITRQPQPLLADADAGCGESASEHSAEPPVGISPYPAPTSCQPHDDCEAV